MNKRLSILVLSALFLGACAGGTAVSTPEGATNEPAADATETPETTGEVELTPEPEATDEGPTQFAPGDVITVTNDGEDWAEIVVSKVSVKKKYDGDYNLDDKPAKGNVYIQALVTYKALANGVDYNPFDWQVFADGEAVETMTFVMNGPKPALASGTLPQGRTAKGWVVYEVPARGKVLMSYQGNIFSDEGPVFEVALRSK